MNWRSFLQKNKINISIFLLVLFHLSAMIGISLGYKDWFVAKTPFTLLLSFILLIWNYPIDSLRKWIFVAVFFLVGMLAEWLGVNKAWLFGSYAYGENLGPEMDGVPYLIGVYWAVLTFVTGSIANRVLDKFWHKIITGSFLMVLLDYFMETAAPVFDFWTFEGGIAPLENYLAWFGVALILHVILQKAKLQGNFVFSFALYLVQLIFFSFFYVLYSI